jgi:tRNA-dihydrouridine synthase B
MKVDVKIGTLVPGLSGPPVLLAPLSGVSDVVFRRIARRWGADLVVTEMVPAHELIRGSEQARLRAAGLGIAPHVVQLVGRVPASMAEAAKLAEDSGADIVDINMGCPAKHVMGGLAGSGLMRDTDLALRIIAAVVQAATIPVSVKMRLGWDDASHNAAEIAARAAALGVQAVTVHGRTRQQFYTGQADWRAIAPVVAAAGVPVIANGDIVDLATARTCLARSGAAGLMVGRAALGQPWLPGTLSAALNGQPIRYPAPAERAALAIEHYEGLLSLYGLKMGPKHARKHLAAYADRARDDGYHVAAEDRLGLVTTEQPAEAIRLLGRVYAEPERRAA